MAMTAVWGRKHLDWWKSAGLKSLSWPKNKEALNGAIWSFLTKEEHRDEIEQALAQSGIRVKDLEFTFMGDILEQNPHAAGHIMKEWFVREGSKCLMYNCQGFTAPPDTIIGDGSVQALREVGNQQHVVVIAAHMRSNTSILSELGDKPLSRAQLVTLGMKHKHKTWEESEFGKDKSNTWVGGVSWRRLGDNLYSVCHLLGTPYLINFTPEDLVYFKNQIHYGVIDHSWPGDVLVPAQRQRVMGSSDGAFMVEITEPDQNIPPLEYVRHGYPDLFHKDLPHNRVNRMTSVIFRGE